MTAKQRKRARCPQPAEECGVWLDTAQLKRRAHQTVIPCTSSSRLNSLPRRCSIDSALFEFTQTKTVQLCTKQTSMYSFINTGKKNKETPNSTVYPSVEEKSFSNPCNKRSEAQTVNLNSLTFESSACMKQGYIVDEPAEDVDSCKSYKDMKEPTQSQQNREVVSSVQDIPANYLHSLNHRSPFKAAGNHSPGSDTWLSGSDKNPTRLLEFTCSKEDYSNDRKQCSTSLPDSHLFTQDSQGNKVICHRFVTEHQSKCCPTVPLQDRTNVTNLSKEAHQFYCDEVSIQKMFTQDSEGNMVIKH